MLDPLDSRTGNCGLLPPMLFERIGSMAADGQHRPRDFTPRVHGAFGAGSACGDPSLPDAPATRSAGPELRPRPPVKATASSIASRTGQQLGNRDTDGEAKGFTGPAPKRHTPQTGASSEDRLRRRHRPPLRPDLPAPSHTCAGSTTGYGGRSTSRPAGRSLDRRRVACTAQPPAVPGENP